MINKQWHPSQGNNIFKDIEVHKAQALYSGVKEKNHRLKMALLAPKPMIQNLDLIPDLTTISGSPRNVI